jgi:hypothetical protein
MGNSINFNFDGNSKSELKNLCSWILNQISKSVSRFYFGKRGLSGNLDAA